jgi:hypothetical protein
MRRVDALPVYALFSMQTFASMSRVLREKRRKFCFNMMITMPSAAKMQLIEMKEVNVHHQLILLFSFPLFSSFNAFVYFHSANLCRKADV